MTKKRYILTGANGHLGTSILNNLKNPLIEVYGLILPGTKTYVDGVTYIEGDVRDKESLRPLFTNFDGEIYVIHTASIISIENKVTPFLKEVNVEGTRNLLDLSIEYNVKRFLYVSSVHALPEANLDLITEIDKFDENEVIGAYAKTKAIATQLVLDYKERLDVVVVHPSGIIGPDDHSGNHLVQLITDYVKGKLPACVDGGYDFVDVRDVATGSLLALEKGRRGECYILSNKHYEIKQVLQMVSKEVKCKKLVVLPIWMAKMVAPIIEGMAKRKKTKPLFTKYSLYTLKANDNFSNLKAKKELGYKTRDLRETIRDTVRWYLSTNKSLSR